MHVAPLRKETKNLKEIREGLVGEKRRETM